MRMQFKSRRMRWAGHVARMGEKMKVYRVLMGNPKESGQSEDRGVDGRMRSKWMSGILASRVSSGFTWYGIGIDGGLL
jgi:hypothetical protein